MHRDILTEVNKIFEAHKLPTIPPTFLKSLYTDTYGIEQKQWYHIFGLFSRKDKNIPKVFGTTISKSCEASSIAPMEGKPYYKVPTILVRTFQPIRESLDTLGIFRVSGNAKRIQTLLDAFGNGPEFGTN